MNNKFESKDTEQRKRDQAMREWVLSFAPEFEDYIILDFDGVPEIITPSEQYNYEGFSPMRCELNMTRNYCPLIVGKPYYVYPFNNPDDPEDELYILERIKITKFGNIFCYLSDDTFTYPEELWMPF
jgi:hypothetical protein